MLIVCWGLYKALNLETIRNESLKHHMNAGRHGKVSEHGKLGLIELLNSQKLKKQKDL